MSLAFFRARKWWIIAFLAVAIVVGFSWYLFYQTYYQTGYIVQLGTFKLGTTLDKEEVILEYEFIVSETRLDQEHLEFLDQPKLHFIEIKEWFAEDETPKIKSGMKNLIQNTIHAWDIRVGQEAFGIVDHKEAAEDILNRVKSAYSKADNEQVSFKEQVTIEEIVARPVELSDPNEIVEQLLAVQSPAKTHIVQEGETIWGIAKQYNQTMDELLVRNPTMGDFIKPGERVILAPEVRTINLVSELEVEEQIDIPFEVERVASSTGVKPREGRPGLKKIVYLVEKENGTAMERSVIQEEVIREPLNKIEVKKPQVQVATKSKPPQRLRSGFIWPTDGGIVTSGFGQRNGRLHKGIDIGGTSSLDIYASYPGEVTFVGEKGTFGNLIIISHDNGLTTYYAHNKKNLVSVGDKVKAGDKIAIMGKTGNATGVILHFEVREKGTAQNPLRYVSQ